MGGDYGPAVVVPASLRALATHPNLYLILVGDEHTLRQHLRREKNPFSDRVIVKHASEIVEMDELPSAALRYKKDSSMRVAINLVKERIAQACVSAGNTGALMATARFVLKTLPGIDRPAIISELPTIRGRARMLDLGANVDSCAEHLVQFAVMGSAVTTALDNIPKPRVGLLNIGEEEIKGNDQVKRTAQLLSDNPTINYIGYVEGDTIYQGIVDVVVCDGFVGNVSLKTSEGVAKLIAFYLEKAFRRNILTRIAALFAMPVLNSLRRQIDPAQYNGASFVGLQGIVIKSHGGANINAFEYAINEAIVEVENNVPQLIREQLAKTQEGQS